MQCTGAAKPGVFTWTITRRGPVIADVIRQSVDVTDAVHFRVVHLADICVYRREVLHRTCNSHARDLMDDGVRLRVDYRYSCLG